MKPFDFSNTLFRCSSLGHLMTLPKEKAARERGDLSESAKTHLIDIYVSKKYNRQSDVRSKYMEKGLMVEEDSITLLSRLRKRMFKKNKETLFNKYIQGTPDLYEGGEDIFHAQVIDELKSSWDIYTFFRVHTKSLNADYYWQVQGYMDLSGATKANLIYCLINTPQVLIDDEKRRLLYQMNAGTTENPDYKEACEELDRLMIYDDIPMQERIIEYAIERNQSDIDLMHAKVERARTYLQNLEHMLHPDVALAESIKQNLLTASE